MVQAACRNNAAIVLLKQKEWEKAEEACTQAIFSLGPDGAPLPRAKAATLCTRVVTLCGGGCNPVWCRLRPRVMQAATLRGGGCDPV